MNTISKLCQESKCARPFRAKGLCNTHYERLRLRGSLGLKNGHKMSGSSEYTAWASMLSRCRNNSSVNFKNYGERGIAVCGRWLKFDNFYEDMGKRPSQEYSIDRVNNDGNYEPSNCRWATRSEQSNNRRTCVKVSFKGKTQTLAQWSVELGINHSTLSYRYRNNMSLV